MRREGGGGVSTACHACLFHACRHAYTTRTYTLTTLHPLYLTLYTHRKECSELPEKVVVNLVLHPNVIIGDDDVSSHETGGFFWCLT